MNYSQLKTAIQSYVENEFDSTDLDVFITQAEQRIYNAVPIAYLRKNVTGALTSGNQYLTLPTDWLDTFSLAVLDSSSISTSGGELIVVTSNDTEDASGARLTASYIEDFTVGRKYRIKADLEFKSGNADSLYVIGFGK